MFRISLRSFNADSPFRYRTNVRVASHIKSKDFGSDVLLFASPNKLQFEALSVLKHNACRSKAFWEVFSKRVNESVHLLNPAVLCDIMRAFEIGNADGSLRSGICHFVSEDISTVGCDKYTSIHDVETVMKFLYEYSTPLDEKTFIPLFKKAVELVYQLKNSSEIEELIHAISRMRQNRKETKVEKQLLLKLTRKTGGSHFIETRSTESPIGKSGKSLE